MTDDPPAEWSEGYDTSFTELAQSAEFVRLTVIDELMERNKCLENRCERLRSALWCAAALAGLCFVLAVAVVVRAW